MALQKITLMKLGKMAGINAVEVYRIMGKSLTGVSVQYAPSEEQKAEEKSEERAYQEALKSALLEFDSGETDVEKKLLEEKIFKNNFFMMNATEAEKLKYFSEIVKNYWEIKYGGVCSRGEAIVLIQYVIDLFQRKPKEMLMPINGKEGLDGRKEFYKQPYGMSDKSPVHRAVMRADIETLRLLMLEDEKLCSKDKTGKKPLDYADDEATKKVLMFAIEKKKERDDLLKKANNTQDQE